jgi:hypothetical protein
MSAAIPSDICYDRYATIDVGGQQLEFDLDMLAPDFYTVMTTSGKGAKYDTFASQTYGTQDSESIYDAPRADYARQSTTTTSSTPSAATQATLPPLHPTPRPHS